MIVNCASINGSSHIENKKSCQDSSGYWTNGNSSIIVVSDGHSSSGKSDLGSKIAVRTSIDILSRIITKKSFLKTIEEERHKDSTIESMEDIKREILQSWESGVEQDIIECIFKEEVESVYCHAMDLLKKDKISDKLKENFGEGALKNIDKKIKDELDRIKMDFQKYKSPNNSFYTDIRGKLMCAIYSVQKDALENNSEDKNKEIKKFTDELIDMVSSEFGSTNLDYENTDITRKDYGATLVIAILLENYFVGFQIGDGGIYTVHSDGRINALTELLDPRCVGTTTTSLCDENPMLHFHSYCKPRKDVVGLIVCTDGFTACYEESEIQKPLRSIISKMDVSTKWYSDIILFLNDLAHKGNKDDVSIAICCDENANYELYESLCTQELPALDHGGLSGIKATTKTRNSCHKRNGKIIEKGTLFNGTIFMDGEFENGSFESGVGCYLFPDDATPISGTVMPNCGISFEKNKKSYNKLKLIKK